MYRPGVCNIGLKNRLGRLGFGVFFFALAWWCWELIFVNSFPNVFRLFLFIPFYLGFLGIYEALFGFCVILSRQKRFDME